MKKYFEYWKNRIVEAVEQDYQEFCRDGKPEEFSIFIFSSETSNNGPCFMSTGAWVWHTDINILASWVIEFQLRNIFACCDEGKDIVDTLDKNGVEYLQYIYEKHKGMRGYETRMSVYKLADELNSMIYAGQLTFDKFADCLKQLEKLSVDLPVSIEYSTFANMDEAMTLLRRHELERGECLDEVAEINRFKADVQY